MSLNKIESQFLTPAVAREYGNAMAQENTRAGIGYQFPISTNTLGTGGQTTNNNQVGKLAGFLGSGMMTGFAGMAANAGTSLIGSGLNYIYNTNKLNQEMAFNNRSLDFQQKQWQTEWDAARSVGLVHPGQLGTMANGFYKSNGSSAQPGRSLYTTSQNSPYTINTGA